MKRLFAAMTAALLVLVLAGSASAAPRSSTLTCFDGGGGTGGTCTINPNGTATLDTSNGGAAGVYYLKYSGRNFYGQQLSKISALSFTSFAGPAGSLLGIDPHWSIPIDTNNDGITEAFAFVAAGTCNNGAGLVDVINDATCIVNYLGVDYANWAAFVAALPAISEVSLTDNYAFIIADSGGPGTWSVSNVVVGSTK